MLNCLPFTADTVGWDVWGLLAKLQAQSITEGTLV